MGLSESDFVKIKDVVADLFKNELLKLVLDKVEVMLSEKFEARIVQNADSIKRLKEAVKRNSATINTLNPDKYNFQKLQGDISDIRSAADMQEQALRNSNIRIFGIERHEGEIIRELVLKLFCDKIKVNIKDSDIQNCYRVSARNRTDNEPPAILVSFFTDVARLAVLKNRKQLKSTGINIKEDLTKFRRELLKAAVDKFSRKRAWCLNGNIYVKHNNVVHRLAKFEDLDKLSA